MLLLLFELLFYHLLKGTQKIKNNNPYSTLIRDNYVLFFWGGGALKQMVVFHLSDPEGAWV